MRSLLIGCLALLAFALAPVRAPAQTWRGPRTEAEKRLVALRRNSTPAALRRAEEIVFPKWAAAVEQHVPGVPDAAAETISGWPGEDLDSVLKWVLFQFTADRRTRQQHRLRPKDWLAALVRRGAVMHSDIALLVSPDPSHLPSPLPSSPTTYYIIEFADGREDRGFHAGVHLEVGRALLALVPDDDALRDPEFDSLWYGATASALLLSKQFGYAEPHLRAGVDDLPNDSRLLFYSGTLHEVFAAPATQRGIEESEMPPGFAWSVAPTRQELELADRLLSRALRFHPTAEIRLHHARVIGLLERHADAAKEFAAAETELTDPVLRYYAALFRGDEEAATGNRKTAREAFERAAALFPQAQSPLIALSRLARRYGDRAAAIAALRKLFALPTETDKRLDPWWIYYESPVRDADALMASLRARFTRETTP